ncbi:hypothetical protein FO510_05435 [Bacillus pumilus]|uniref:hypothetical protein n=1 Tax=Bacillus pumilus TaxID=1408 RepID=UPI000556F1D4|nr:hypothetical protein [Bacillus pumilus]MCR4352193.1 hypothetical protein [Bacillus pumilus]MCY7504004.1 hypothetical protein [Bacillus pumilus]MDR4269007.1 hypothetical protein [Bacillus pumilus]MDR4269094.1 hypothetical protein [Bacillus pumilus]MED4724289.1 hypothetical protein [Bacillus pumilus]
MDKAMAYIDKLAAKLGVAAEHVYGVLVKQAVVGGGVSIGASLVLLLIAIVIPILCMREAKRRKGVIPDGLAIAFGWCVFISVFLLILACILGVNGIKAVLNPEYYAIIEILDTIGGK